VCGGRDPSQSRAHDGTGKALRKNSGNWGRGWGGGSRSSPLVVVCSGGRAASKESSPCRNVWWTAPTPRRKKDYSYQEGQIGFDWVTCPLGVQDITVCKKRRPGRALVS